jgi:hypothetical protein
VQSGAQNAALTTLQRASSDYSKDPSVADAMAARQQRRAVRGKIQSEVVFLSRTSLNVGFEQFPVHARPRAGGVMRYIRDWLRRR